MRTIKSKKRQYELAQQGLLLFICDGRYVQANVGHVIAHHGKLTFYARN